MTTQRSTIRWDLRDDCLVLDEATTRDYISSGSLVRTKVNNDARLLTASFGRKISARAHNGRALA